MAEAKSKKISAQERARQAALEEAKKIKAQREAKERRMKMIGLVAVVAVAIIVAVIVVLVLQTTNGPGFDEIEAKPTGAQESGALLIGQDLVVGGQPARGDDVVVLRVYSDYICPGCGSVEGRLGQRMEDMAAAGQIQLEIAPLVTLDGQSTTRYSSRATDAAMVVANYSPDKFLAFHKLLFANQPPEGSAGLSDDELKDLARQVEVPETTIERFGNDEFAEWIAYANSQAQKQPVQTTPSLWMGKSDSDLTLVKNPGSINLDRARQRVLAGQDLNQE
ncbi:MAG: DsbA family protein [Bifidobacteriaceae bacterium]|jgi:protein-disulfide isomerase|nr:DsbA family protein [Bifidobacteriaceae bacterium]